MSATPAFTSYACSLGLVLDYDDGTIYRIQTPSGQVIGIRANGEPSEENVEADIANPRELPVDPVVAWNEFLAGSITDASTGLELKASIAACNRFTAMETLLKSALEHGAITGESNVSLWDRSNVEHVLTVNACRALLLRYGIAWQSAFNALAP